MVEATCRDPFMSVNASSAAVYRSISDDLPTMLVDEADTIFGPKADGNGNFLPAMTQDCFSD
ncbi:hypothetical protein OU415_07565 [Saccharopolyspora sp. WRP15-2]|uniref:DUF3631 domain-containing protein n=1 Tax=Saccharopolyspora oryzae TaxID=2997343 RepID=A0ABT4UU88_9PSEU|nr:hypothetical protein [Saccharopolyspora oryzae]MDA3625288.1 hypothetical protein [Saccharopolyspora oryzae]